jgi:hypothetical protein
MNIKIKNKSIIWWILQIIPPLFILPLSAMPMDISTSIFWGAGIIALFISMFNICRKGINLFRDKERKNFIASITRPILTIIFMIVAISSVKYSLSEAENYAFNTAKNIQEKCNINNSCPDFIATWNKRDDSFKCDFLAGGLAKYRLLYDVSNDRKEFRIMLRVNIDRHLNFRGGVGKEVKRD